MHKIQLYIQKEKANDPKFQLYIFCSIFNLFVSLIFSLLSNHFFLLHVPHLLMSYLQPLDYIEYRHIVQTSVPISLSSSILNKKMHPKKKEEKKKKRKRNLETTSAPQCTLDAMPTGHAAIVLCDCSCLFRADMLQGRNSFVWHIYLL